MDHIASIRIQVQELDAEIRKDPRVAALQHLKAALAALEGRATLSVQTEVQHSHNGDSVADQIALNSSSRPDQPRMLRSAREGSKIKQVYVTVGAAVDVHGSIHRKDIATLLADKGLMEGVQDHLRAVSANMNTLKDYFTSDGRGNFRRREGAPSELIISYPKKSISAQSNGDQNHEAAQQDYAGGP